MVQFSQIPSYFPVRVLTQPTNAKHEGVLKLETLDIEQSIYLKNVHTLHTEKHKIM